MNTNAPFICSTATAMAIAESLTELPHPGFDRSRRVLHFSAFPLCRARGLQAPHMFLIRPIDTQQRRELGLLPHHFAF
jgi:hypothetical protein